MKLYHRDARTVAEVQLEKRPVTLHFLLWNRRTWVLKHPNDYWYYATHRAELEAEEVSEEPLFFVECLNPAEELLWFGDLVKYRLLRHTVPYNITPDVTEHHPASFFADNRGHAEHGSPDRTCSLCDPPLTAGRLDPGYCLRGGLFRSAASDRVAEAFHRTNACSNPREKPTGADAVFIQDNALLLSHTLPV